MPVPRRRAPRRKLDPSKLTPAQIEHLVEGYVWWSRIGLTGEEWKFPFASPEQRREFWKMYRADLMGRRETVENRYSFTNIVYPAATRPSAWWDYEAPERRPLIRKGKKGAGAYPDDYPGQTFIFGLPQLFRDNYGAVYPPHHEPQWRYLKRLRLLDKGELDAATLLARLKFEQRKNSQYPPKAQPESIEDLLDEYIG